MSEERWTEVDEYVCGLLEPADAALEAALDASKTAGLPAIQVSAAQGRLLQLLALANGSKRILEIGTLGGYSTIWLARALPAGGRLLSLEVDPHHLEVARQNIARAGLTGVVTQRLGAALETLPRLQAEGEAPFDFVFVDADKENMADYVRWSMRLAAPGALIVADNVVREGAVVDAASADPRVQGVRRMLDLVAAEPRVSATVIQTVGAKGYDGFALIRVTG